MTHSVCTHSGTHTVHNITIIRVPAETREPVDNLRSIIRTQYISRYQQR